MADQQTLTNRSSWADACRLIAIFGVILIHIAGPVRNSFHTISLDAYLAANAFDSLSRVSVPLFTMLSGALLLGRETSISAIGGRIVRVALPLAFWSFIYVYWIDSWTGKSLDVVGALIRMVQAPVMYHLWFVYMIIGVYMTLPILQAITNLLISDKKYAVYFFSLWFGVNSITVYYPISIIQQLDLSNFLGWPGYFILGYYLTNSDWFLGVSSRLNALVFLLASLCTFSLSWHFNALSPTPNVTAYDYFSPNVVIASIAVFLWIRKIKVSDSLVKPLAFLAGTTFPIYFMHIFIISLLTGKNHGFSMSPYTIHPVVGIPELAIITFFTSMLIALSIRPLPYSSRIIG